LAMFGSRGQDASRSKKTRRRAIEGENWGLTRFSGTLMISPLKFVPVSNHRLSN
jgi:hypothetical protein